MHDQNLEQIILTIAEHVLSSKGITNKPTLEASLAETGLGLDSLGRLTLLAEIEKKMQIEFSEQCWEGSSFANLKDILAYLNRNHLDR